MGIFDSLLNRGPSIPREQKAEVDELIAELIQIGQKEDFLSEYPGGAYNGDRRHLRTRNIGRKLDQIGGLGLMMLARQRVKRKLGATMAEHLDYAWTDVGRWMP